MIVKTDLFGEVDIPEDEKAIMEELEGCKKRYLHRTSRYEQCRIDCLEEALDKFRRVKEDVRISRE